jgi:hypothetical protein
VAHLAEHAPAGGLERGLGTLWNLASALSGRASPGARVA